MDLDPSVPSSLDVITAVRAGVATYTDASGVIQSAAANTVRVDQTQGAELTPNIYQLVGNTDFTQSHWTKTASTVESGHISPDGNANAYKLIEDTSDSVHRIFETSTVSASPNATISLFVKYSGRRYVLIRFADQSAGRWYDLINGTLGGTYLNTPNDSTIEAIGSDWYRITLTHTSTAQARCEFWVADTESVSSYTGDGESGVYIYGPQLEEGTTASSFVANTTGSPKFITGATYGPRVPMMLIEPSATNLVTYSEAIGSNSFAKVGTTIDSNVTVSPDGTASADLLKDTDASGSHFMFKDLTLASGQAYTISVFAKRNGVDRDLRLGDGGLGWSSGFTSNAVFDLTEGTVSGGGTIENIGNDWYRCSVTGTTNATTARLIVYSTLNGVTSYQGDGESGIYLWGFQIEAGSVATSYIPTSGSTVTRAKDDLSIDPDSTNHITNTDFSTWATTNMTVATGGGYAGRPSSIITATGSTGSKFLRATLSGVTAGQTHTASIYVRRVSGSGSVEFEHQGSTAGGDQNVTSQVGSDWNRIDTQFNGSTSGGVVTSFAIRLFTEGDALEIAMPQVELGSSPTGFIPTSGAAASRTAFSDFYNSGGDGTFFLTAVVRNPVAKYSILRGGSNVQLYVYSNAGGRDHFNHDGGGSNYGNVVENQLTNFAVSYNASTHTISRNGNGPTTVSASGNFRNATKLEIGKGYDSAGNFNGHIKRVIYWPTHSDSL